MRVINLANPFWFTPPAPTLPIGNIVSAWQGQSDATDSVGANDGTATGVSYNTGKVGNCMDFTSATTSKVIVPDAANLSFGDGSTDSPFSVSFYVKFNAFVATQVLFQKYDNPYEYRIEVASSGSIISFFTRDDSAGANLGRRDPTTGFTTGVWYHIVCTYDGSSTAAGYEIYIDGVASTSQSIATGTYTAMESTSSDVTIGHAVTTFHSHSLDGYLDEIFLWDIELSASQASDLYDEQNAGTDILV